MSDDIDPADTFDPDRVEVDHLMRTRGVDERTAWAILDERQMERERRIAMSCRHGHPIGIYPCGECPCPAGGEHQWGEQDSGDMYGPIGGGPGTVVRRWVACDNCGATPPKEDEL